jgi:hypothetical protein
MVAQVYQGICRRYSRLIGSAFNPAIVQPIVQPVNQRYGSSSSFHVNSNPEQREVQTNSGNGSFSIGYLSQVAIAN